MVLQREFEKTLHTWSITWSCMMSEEWEFLSDFLGDQFTSWSTRFDYLLLSMEMLVLAIKLFSPFLQHLSRLFDSVTSCGYDCPRPEHAAWESAPFVWNQPASPSGECPVTAVPSAGWRGGRLLCCATAFWKAVFQVHFFQCHTYSLGNLTCWETSLTLTILVFFSWFNSCSDLIHQNWKQLFCIQCWCIISLISPDLVSFCILLSTLSTFRSVLSFLQAPE